MAKPMQRNTNTITIFHAILFMSHFIPCVGLVYISWQRACNSKLVQQSYTPAVSYDASPCVSLLARLAAQKKKGSYNVLSVWLFHAFVPPMARQAPRSSIKVYLHLKIPPAIPFVVIKKKRSYPSSIWVEHSIRAKHRQAQRVGGKVRSHRMATPQSRFTSVPAPSPPPHTSSARGAKHPSQPRGTRQPCRPRRQPP